MGEIVIMVEIGMMAARRRWAGYLERRAYAGHGRHALVMA